MPDLPYELYDALSMARFTDVQRRIVMALVGLSHARGRQHVAISVPRLAQVVDTTNSGWFRDALGDLITEGVIVRVHSGGGHSAGVLAVSVDYEQWGRFSIARAAVEARFGPVLGDDDAQPSRTQDGWNPSTPADRTAKESSTPVHRTSNPQPSRPQDGCDSSTPADRQSGVPAILPTGTLAPAIYKTTTTTTTPHATREEIPSEQPAADAQPSASAAPLAGPRDAPAAAAAVPAPPAAEAATPELPELDSSQLKRWPELAELLVTDHARSHVLRFLAGFSGVALAGWVGRLTAWLEGLDCPKAPRPDVLAAALSEYSGDGAPRHVWAFVADVMRRYELAEAPTSAPTSSGSGISGASARASPGAWSRPRSDIERTAAAMWPLIRDNGLASCHPQLISTRVAQLAKDGLIVDADAFLSALRRIPRSQLADARTEHFAIRVISDALATTVIHAA